jgi:asparagine synthetase B (glutamine-hydrolysing)
MCSIGGFISKEPIDAGIAANLCRALLYYGVDRGRQSAGVYTGGRLLKRAQDPHHFISRDDFDELFQEPVQTALVHTRQPTSGGTTDEQAHPFVIGNVAAVHNGWLTNCEELKKKFHLDKPSGVDSELVTAYIAQHGIEALPDFLKATQGSSAVAALLDNRDLYFMRDGNPIEYLYIQDGGNGILLFGSTESQVLNAGRYLWLLPPYTRTITLKNSILFKATHDGVEQLSEPISKTYNYRGRGNYYSDDSDYEGWRTPHNSTPVQHHGLIPLAAPALLPPLTLPLHDNKRDTIIQQQLGPNFLKVTEDGKTKWVYKPTQAGHVSGRLSRRERRQLERKQKAATEHQTADTAASRNGTD